MRKALLLTLAVLATVQLASAQTVIVDFETPETSTTFQYFGSSLDGMLTQVVENPVPDGINSSDSVGMYVKAAGAMTWAGAFSNPNPATPVDLTSATQVCIKVYFDHIGNIALKLENSTTGGSNWVQTQPNTVENGWEEICFDVTQASEEDPFQPAAGHVYPTVTLFFDFGMEGGENDVNYYFDDIVVPPALTCSTVLDFETDTTSTVFQYFGSSLDGTVTSVVANPNPSGINPSDSVTEFVKPEDAMTWAGAFSNPNPAIPVDLTMGNQVCVKVHMDHIGNLALKLENSTSGGDNWILTQPNTVTDEWEQLCFDVSQPSEEPPGTPASGHVFETVTLFFDFGSEGDTVAVTNYIDDIEVCESGGASFADVTFTVDMSEYQEAFDVVYVSGTFNGWSGDANPLDDTDGDNIWEATLNLPIGPHEFKYTLDNWTVQEMFTGFEDCVISDSTGEFTNRRLIVSESGADLDTVCWNSCYACGESIMLTVNLGTSHFTPDTTGMYIAGGGTFGIPGDYPLTEVEPDVWTITFEKPIGFASYYTFTNGLCPDYSCKENIAGQDCANPDNFNDRYMGPFMQDTVINTCFAQCTEDLECAAVAADGNITFNVDMSDYEGDFTQVYVSGSFNNWSGEANPLDDTDGDMVWEGTLFLNGGSHEFKFTLDNWTAQEEFQGGEDCTITDPSGQFHNRLLEVDGDAVLDTVCFNSCSACGTSATRNVRVDPDLFRLEPTLTSDVARVHFRESSNADRHLEVLNVSGQVVFATLIPGADRTFTITTGLWNPGMYIVQVHTGDKIGVRKLIKN